MDLHLQPLATTCFVSGEPFTEGARVASFLVRTGAAMEIVRYDVLETKTEGFSPEGVLACKWVHPFKPRRAGETVAARAGGENVFRGPRRERATPAPHVRASVAPRRN